MMIVGCDYHPAFQQIAFVDTDTGELHASRSRRVGRLLSAFFSPQFYRSAATNSCFWRRERHPTPRSKETTSGRRNVRFFGG